MGKEETRKQVALEICNLDSDNKIGCGSVCVNCGGLDWTVDNLTPNQLADYITQREKKARAVSLKDIPEDYDENNPCATCKRFVGKKSYLKSEEWCGINCINYTPPKIASRYIPIKY